MSSELLTGKWHILQYAVIISLLIVMKKENNMKTLQLYFPECF